MLKRLLLSAVLSLIVSIVVYFSIQVQPTTETVPVWVTTEIEAFSAQLGVSPPTVQHAEFDGVAFISCNGRYGNCSLSFGKKFNTSGWQENSAASRALLAHELGHVLQDSEGRSRRLDPSGLLFFLVALVILASFPNVRHRLAATLWIFGVAAVSRWLDFISFDQVMPLMLFLFLAPAIATVLSGCLLFLTSGRKDHAYRDLGLSAGRLMLVVALVLTGWLNVRGIAGAGQVLLEFEADQISACLTSPVALIEMEKKSSGGHSNKSLLKPVYHPSYDDRISAMQVFKSQRCKVHK